MRGADGIASMRHRLDDLRHFVHECSVLRLLLFTFIPGFCVPQLRVLAQSKAVVEERYARNHNCRHFKIAILNWFLDVAFKACLGLKPVPSVQTQTNLIQNAGLAMVTRRPILCDRLYADLIDNNQPGCIDGTLHVSFRRHILHSAATVIGSGSFKVDVKTRFWIDRCSGDQTLVPSLVSLPNSLLGYRKHQKAVRMISSEIDSNLALKI